MTLLATGCPSTQRAAPTPVNDLQDRLWSTLLPLEQAGTAISLVVVDGLDGRVLAAVRPDERVVPASTQKMLTMAAVLARIPHDTRFETILAGPAANNGVVDGDLWLIGGGDPAFGSARGLPGAPIDDVTPSTALADMARALVEAGVKEVRGSVVGDGRLLPPPGLMPGWSWDDIPYTYSAPPSGLTYLEGGVELRMKPQNGGFSVVITPPTSEVRVFPSMAPPAIENFTLLPGSRAGDVLALWPQNPKKTSAREWVAAPDAARFAAEQLTAALTTAGINVSGAPRSALATDRAVSDVTWARHTGQTVRELAGHVLRESLNLHAETLLMHLGRLASSDGSTRGGLKAVAEHIASIGRDPTGFRVVDGSGLSRMNLLSGLLLVDILRETLRRDPGFELLLPVAGGPGGTLQNRLVGTPGAGRIRAKTGTLTGHRNLVGLVHTLKGRTLFFAIMLSGVVVPRQVADSVVDQAMLLLVQE